MRSRSTLVTILGVLIVAGSGMAMSEAGGQSRPGADRDAFGKPMRGIDSATLAKFNYGLGLFRHERQPVVAADGAMSGPGPLFNATSCSGCHLRDGRGAPVDDNGDVRSMVFVLASPGGGDPVYGAQVQDRSVDGMLPEAVPSIEWVDAWTELADGTSVQLRRPKVRVEALGYGPLAPDSVIDPRVAPQLVGLGLLAAVDDAAILALADPDDRDGDGISGVASAVEQGGQGRLGRFGWKATMSDLEAQTQKAASLDMGLSVPGAPSSSGDCTSAQADCLQRASAERLDLQVNDIALLAFYVAHLDVPDRRTGGDIDRGEAVFRELACTGCHVERLHTSPHAAPEFADREIAAYTDLLLHDMGPELAGGVGATRNEWRTPPLWGIGLTGTVSGHTQLLHDGRARDFSEAILWHGGEARTSRDGFASLGADDRAALVAFLESL